MHLVLLKSSRLQLTRADLQMFTTPISKSDSTGRLVNASGLLEALFGEKRNQPSMRWLYYQLKRKTIPHFKISGLTRFDPVMVRQALEKNCLITARGVK